MENNIYQTLIEERKFGYLDDPVGFKQEVLSQLMVIAFENADIPDTLPKHFRIENVLMSTEGMEKMFNRMRIDATIVQVYSPNGVSFDVTLNNFHYF